MWPIPWWIWCHTSPLWTEWVTNACVNITFARFATRAVIKSEIKTLVLQLRCFGHFSFNSASAFVVISRLYFTFTPRASDKYFLFQKDIRTFWLHYNIYRNLWNPRLCASFSHSLTWLQRGGKFCVKIGRYSPRWLGVCSPPPQKYSTLLQLPPPPPMSGLSCPSCSASYVTLNTELGKCGQKSPNRPTCLPDVYLPLTTPSRT